MKIQSTIQKEALNQRINELEIIGRIAQKLTSSLSLNEVIQSIYNQVYEAIKPDLLVFYTVENDHLISAGEKPANPLFHEEAPDSKKVGQCLCGLVVMERKPIYSLNIHNDSRCTLTECKNAGIQSFAAIPILSEDDVIGVLGIGSFTTRDFSTQELFLETIADHIAIALKNARLYIIKQGITVQLAGKVAELEKTSKSLYLSEQLFKNILNSLSANIAIVDQEGIIIETNGAWRRFAEDNHIKMPPDTIGVNYLEICDLASGHSSEGASEVGQKIRDVVAGKKDIMVLEYPCHSPEERRWFYMQVTPFPEPAPRRVVIAHENITALKNVEENLKKTKLELELKTQHLQESNIALKVLLRQREQDKREYEQNVLSNLNTLVKPYLDKIKRSNQDLQQKLYLDIIETNLDQISSPALNNISSFQFKLTPQEIQVANLIREGKTTKEIAEILIVSANSVHFYRKSIRKKLGLKQKKTNLRSYLLSVS